MDADTASDSAPPSCTTDVLIASPLRESDDPLQSPAQMLLPAVIARRQISKTGDFGSPVRRSSRLSGLPPLQSPHVYQHTQNMVDESSDNESESLNDVALQLSREDTPENDVLLPDEPSTILASRIIRAHDNPSPPPQNLAQLATNYLPGKNGQLPLLRVSPPPSSFRPINLLERLDSFTHSSPDMLRSPRYPTPKSSNRAELPESSAVPSPGLILPGSYSPSLTPVPVKGEDLASIDTFFSSSTPPAIHSPSLPSHRVREPTCLLGNARIDFSSQRDIGPCGQPVTMASSFDPEAFGPLPTQANDSSLPPTQDTKPIVSGAHSNAQEASLVDSKDLSVSNEEKKSKCRITTEANANSHQRLNSLSPHSADVLAGLCLPPKPASSIDQTVSPAEFIQAGYSLATPPRTSRHLATHSNFSQSTIKRPIIPPTPVRMNNGPQRPNSPLKLSSKIDDIHRTPAQRVPIETVLTRGASSLQRKAFAGQPHQGNFLTIGTPVFLRPALDDPSRSPAKRIPITDAMASPLRLGLRAKSVSVEPHPVGPIPNRSRSAEPSAVTSKFDSHGKSKESIFPSVPVSLGSGIKLPFPLSGPKPSNDLPPSIPEEHEDREARNNETDTMSNTASQSNTMSRLRQPFAKSRIPRIGNKPYTRPVPKNGKVTQDTTTTNDAGAPDNRVTGDNIDATSTQRVKDSRSLGSLKRKRGADATVPSNSHPVMVRQVVPGILNEKYAPKSAKISGQVQVPLESSSKKAPPPEKFRKVVDGMLSARYASAKTNLALTEPSDLPPPLSPLSELSSSSSEELSDANLPPIGHSPVRIMNEAPHASRTERDASAMGLTRRQHTSLNLDADVNEPSTRPRRTSRARKPAQQQYVLDVFSNDTSTRPPPLRRKTQSRKEDDLFMGMNATALRSLTTSNTTKNQQTVAVLATEVIRKEGLRPESPTVKARTILQKQRDERDKRRKERAQRRGRTSEEDLGDSDAERQTELDPVSLGAHADHEDCTIPQQQHRRGPGDEEDYKTPERLERVMEIHRLEGADGNVKPVKQVKWHRELSTAVYLDEVDPKPKSAPKNDSVTRGCLAPTSKNLPLDSLGNLVDIDSRPSPELAMEQIIVKKYLYDNDIEPEPIPVKVTRSKSKKSKS